MNKKRKKNQAKRNKQHDKEMGERRAGSRYVEVPAPYSDVPLDEFMENLQLVAEKASETFKNAVVEIRSILLSYNPLILLAGLSYYFFTAYEGMDRILDESQEVLQFHAELLQGMIMQHPADGFDDNYFQLPDYLRIRKLLQGAATAFALKRLRDAAPSMSDEEKHLLFIKEVARSQTMIIRNWAYPHQVITITRDLFSNVDKGFVNLYGITVGGLLTMFDRAIDKIEARLNRHRKALVPVAKATDLDTAVRQYFEGFPDLKDSPEELIDTLKSDKNSLEEAKRLIIRHSNLRLPSIYSFSIKELVSFYPEPVTEQVILKVLEKISLRFGELEDTDIEHLFLNNPIWSKPIIDIGKGEYFFPVPALYYSFCIDIFRELTAVDPELLKTYEKARARYLEQRVREVLERSFPDAQIFCGSQWYDSGSEEIYENDVLVQLDSHIILIEAKSGRVTPPARRGAKLRLSDTIEKLIIEPAKQGSAFEEYLLSHPDIHEFSTKRGTINKVDSRNTKKVIRLSVTLDPFNLIGVTWPVMQRAGFIPNDVQLTPTICLPDLEVILEILESPFEILHYLSRRSDLEAHTAYVGEELDLLGFYLDNQFNIEEMEFRDSPIMMEHMSKVIDEFFPGRGQLDESKKPKCKRAKWWKDILDAIRQRKPQRWTELGVMLLDVPYERQKALEKGIQRIQQSVAYAGGEDRIDHVQLVCGPEQRRTVIVCVAYQDMGREKRNRMLRDYAAEAMQDHGTDLAIVIAENTDSKDYPYSVIALFSRHED